MFQLLDDNSNALYLCFHILSKIFFPVLEAEWQLKTTYYNDHSNRHSRMAESCIE